MAYNQDLEDQGNDAADKIERGFIVPLGIIFAILIFGVAIIALANQAQVR